MGSLAQLPYSDALDALALVVFAAQNWTGPLRAHSLSAQMSCAPWLHWPLIAVQVAGSPPSRSGDESPSPMPDEAGSFANVVRAVFTATPFDWLAVTRVMHRARAVEHHEEIERRSLPRADSVARRSSPCPRRARCRCRSRHRVVRRRIEAGVAATARCRCLKRLSSAPPHAPSRGPVSAVTPTGKALRGELFCWESHPWSQRHSLIGRKFPAGMPTSSAHGAR